MGARWTKDEWNSVCMELYRTQPVATMTSKDFKEIKTEHMISAMKSALPVNRWHLSMNMTHVRPKLQEVFKELREKLQKVEAEQAEAAKQREEAERMQAKHRSRVDLFAPLIDAITDRILESLIPSMESYIGARLGGSSPEEAEAVARERPSPQAKPLRVGVIGLIPIQANELKDTFPFLEFVFDEGSGGGKQVKAKMGNCDAVFGLVHKSSHGPEKWFNREIWHPVGGRGLTSVKRSIQVWLAARS